MTTLTLPEVADQVTVLYHLQRVNFEEADRISREVTPIWKRLPKNHRLRDVATSASGSTAHLYNRTWNAVHEKHHNETAFVMTALLFPLLNEWPAFYYADEEKNGLIATWTELLGLSEDAHNLNQSITETGQELQRLLMNPEQGLPAQDLRGWYAKVWTSRRSTTGWIVGGRGQTLHVLEDPLFHVRRASMNHHSKPVTDAQAAMAACVAALRFEGTTPWWSAEPERYSLKSTTIQLMLPPDGVAVERKDWVKDILAKAASTRADAIPRRDAYAKWLSDTAEIRKAHTKRKEFENSLSSNLKKDWLDNQSSHLRWVNGAREAIRYILKSVSEEDLRAAIIEEWLAAHPLSRLTEPELAMLNSPPPGNENLDRTMAGLVVEKYKGLAPTF